MRFVSNVLGRPVISWEEDMAHLPPVGAYIWHDHYQASGKGAGRVHQLEYNSMEHVWIVHLNTFYKKIPT